MTEVKSIKLVKNGTITVEASERPELSTMGLKKLCGIGGGSSVSLIESDAKILVDTGFDFETNLSEENIKKNKKDLIHALKNIGLKPDDIDIVFITHWHKDHFGNMKVFKNSEFVVSELTINRFNLNLRGVKDGEDISDGVKVVYTPGHTEDHASLFIETNRLQYSEMMGSGGIITGLGKPNIVVAGDAVISASYYITNKIWNHNADFFSEESATDSINKINKFADFIIPGHGGILKAYRNKEV
jgi:glyoxylase-like metal-dependent hydrolase (beta-lactamase superfamily II)